VGAGTCNFPTDTENFQRNSVTDRLLRISDGKDCGAQNFSFAPRVPENGFLDPNFAFLDENFRTRIFSDNFPTAKNLGVRGSCCLATLAMLPLLYACPNMQMCSVCPQVSHCACFVALVTVCGDKQFAVCLQQPEAAVG